MKTKLSEMKIKHKQVISRPLVSSELQHIGKSKLLFSRLTEHTAPRAAPRSVSVAPINGAWAEWGGGSKERVQL